MISESMKTPHTVFSKNRGFAYDGSGSPDKNIDLMKDKTYIRRIKKENYGKWYLKANAYEKKNKKLDNELSRF